MKITWIILLSMCLSTLSSASGGGVMPSSCANPGSNSRKVFNVKKLSAMKQLITKKIAPGLLNIQKYNPSGQLGKKLKPLRQAFSKNQIQKKLLAPVTFLIAVQQGKKKTSSANFEKALRVFIQNVDAYMAKISTYQQLTKSVKNSKLHKVVKSTSEQTLRLAKKLHSDYQKPLGAYGTPSVYPAPGISTQHMGGAMMPNTATRPMAWPQQGVYPPSGMMPGRGQQVVGFGTQPYSMQPGVVPGTNGNQQNIDQSAQNSVAQAQQSINLGNPKGISQDSHLGIQSALNVDQKNTSSSQPIAPTQVGNLASAAQCPCVGQTGAQALSANAANSQGVNSSGGAAGAGSTANSQGANLGGSAVGAGSTDTKVADKELLAAEQSAAQLAVEAAKAAEIVLEMAKQSAEESAVVAETALENADQHVSNTTQEAEKKQQKAEELEIAAQNAKNAIPPSATGAAISEDGIIKVHSNLSGTDTKSSLANATSSSQENLDGTKVIYVDANHSVLIKSSANQVVTTTDVTTPTPQAAAAQTTPADVSQQQSVTDTQKPESSASDALSDLNNFSQSQIDSTSTPAPDA